LINNQIKNISILLFCFLLINSLSVIVQAEIEEPAEIIATIDTTDNKIPPIKVSEWTSINITVKDAFGINWADLSSRLPIRANYIWKIIHPDWRPFLGFTSLRFEPEIIEGNPKGWELKPLPTISNADQGKIYNLTLQVRTNDISVDYSVVIGIKVTRVNVYGEDFGTSYIYIPVKASSLNNIKMDTTLSTKEVPPHSHTHFDVTVKNFGYYKDMFQLEFINDGDLKVAASGQVFVLNPGESQNIRISVLTPEKIYDFGTPNAIEVYATSTSDPNPVLLGTIVVITKGAYISPLTGIILAPMITILILIYFRKQKKEQELFGKPQKPWNIPIERKHLEELKQKDKEAYEKERLMMEDEYKSAMLWYDSYRQSIKQEKQIGKSKQFNLKVNEFFKKPEDKKEKPEEKKPIKKQKDKTENSYSKFFSKSEKKEKQPEKEKKPEKKVEKPKEKKEEKPKETPEIVKEQYKAVQKRSAESERRKQIALEKIKRAQEKQKGKRNRRKKPKSKSISSF